LWVHCYAPPTHPGAAGNAAAFVNASSTGSMTVGSNGSALSYAASSQSAGARLVSSATDAHRYSGMNASLAGETATQSAGTAFNASSGSGSGWARSSGAVGAAVQGRLGVRDASNADGGGNAETRSTFLLVAERGQGGHVQGSTSSGFESSLSFQRTGGVLPCPERQTDGTRSSGVSMRASTTGYVTGTNVSQTLAGMNAPGVASISASGYFNGLGQLGALGAGSATGH
jgi:hypothetical protein